MWDGLLTSEKSAIVVIGATNRPQDIDPAILRRMPRVFQVPTPSEQERRGILSVVGVPSGLVNVLLLPIPLVAAR
jgi:SpoVK/Ycf46/Vps4 family AAA+-type ATPase